MESLSHSRQPNRSGKRICNGNTNNVNFAASKSTYDDVFGGPPKFGAPTLSPRMEDYAEIFGTFHAARASSIPVLDLPAVDESEVFFDVRGSSFDYTEVFGGFNGLDFAVSYDDLVQQTNGGYDGSSEEAWTPAETESLFGESDRDVHNHCLSNGEYQSYDGNTEFNISYYRTNVRSSEDMSNGMIHQTQVHAVPGFTYMVDETASLHKVDTDMPSLQVAEDSDLNMNFDRGMGKKSIRKAKLDPVYLESERESFVNDSKLPKEIIKDGSEDGSRPIKSFVGISEVSLKTHPSNLPPPSRPPPALDVRKGNFKTPNHGGISSEGREGRESPPYFDVEVDANSSAAVSAAAMKKAMVKAQARLRSAKELMEKKKDGGQSHTVLSSTDARTKEGNVVKLVDGSGSLTEEKLEGTSDTKNTGQKYAVGEERQEALSKTEVIPNVLQGEDFFDLACKPGEERHRKRSWSSQGSDDIDGSGEWKDSTQYFELVKTDKSKKAFEQISNGKTPVEDANYGFGENTRNMNRVEKEHAQDKDGTKLKEDNDRENASREVYGKNENVKKAKAAKVVSSREETGGKITTAEQSAKCEKKLTGPNVSDILEIKLRERESEAEQAMKYWEKEKELVDVNTRTQSEKMEKKIPKREHEEKIQRKVLEQEEKEKEKEKEKRLKKAFEHKKNEKNLREAHRREESHKRVEAPKQQKNEKKSTNVLQQEHDEKRSHEAFKWKENEKGLSESCEGKGNRTRLIEAHVRVEREKRGGASEAKDNGRILEGPWERELSEARSIEDYMQDEIENSFDMSTAEEISDTGKAQECDVQKRVHEHTDKDQNGRKLEVAKGPLDHPAVKNCAAPDEMNQLNGDEKFQENHLVQDRDGSEEQLEATLKTSSCEVNVIQSTGHEDKIILEAAKGMVVEEKSRASSFTEMGDLEHEVSQSRVKEMVSDNGKKAGEDDASIWMEKTKIASKVDSRPENQCSESANELGEREKAFTAAHVTVNEGGKKDKHSSIEVLKDSIETGSKTEAAQPPSSQGRGNIQKIAQHVPLSHCAERREKTLDETSALKYKGTERMKREKELEEERLRKIEEEREREREREKDRMALDRETLGIRDNVKMERMTSEARQKAMAEARDRLERACAEAREKTLADKALMEARLRAERAAVERATAEARERAAEKAMTERAAFEARQRMERSISDKFSACAASGMGQSHSSSALQDQQFRSISLSSSTRYHCSSAYGEKADEVEGETAQRCRARLERYRRTAERAAKALAEKNMRDLLVQKEQAERSRLAETLDAEVKRWSSGKEGNLRALLSTLQYILGPDSGWQPIPLTEVITSAAVKKAYRKATLCVHPDKLQQRGASIQQKYICEKVFDLLKEAWVKFNSEER